MRDDGVAANRAAWDDWADWHVGSSFYDVPGFLAGRDTLDRLETSAFGDVRGQRLLHLQCHFGLASLSWARRGADVTGVDFAPRAVAHATRLAAELDLPARFVCADVTQPLPDLGPPFDLVFASYGVLCWLPELAGWAANVARSLAPGGRFWLVEIHPTLMLFDDARAELPLRLGYRYFDRQVRRFTGSATYAAAGDTEHTSHEWAYRTGEVLNALIDAGLRIARLEEHPLCCYQALPVMVQDAEGFWVLPEGAGEIPLTFAVEAVKA